MRWWICCAALVVVALVTIPVLYSPPAAAEVGAPGPASLQAVEAPEGAVPETPAPAEPSLDLPEPVPLIDFCCEKCDARYNLCEANCGGNWGCIQNCISRFETCAAGCGSGC